MTDKSVTGGVAGRYSLILAPVFVVLIVAAFFFKVNLEPKITPDFFFSSDSEIFKKNQTIRDVFPSQQQILLNVTTAGSIEDPNFIEKIGIVTNRVKAVEGVTDVQSITNGPDDLEAARENPLWRRLLIGKDEQSSFVLAFVDTDEFAPLVEEIEQIVGEEKNRWFDIRISGLPYIVEQIRRNLMRDMKNFTTGAILLSALVVFAVFRSVRVVLGALVACASAAMLTLTIQSLMGVSIGILTANLGIIVFVLTLSHVIFLTSNWRNIDAEEPGGRRRATIGHTLPASTWAALTTLLGFFSLIFVEAKPLNQLGVGGTIGAFSALLCAYLIFPAFLHDGVKSKTPALDGVKKAKAFRHAPMAVTCVTLALALGLGLPGLARLNTDPSLLSYFKEESDLHKGIFFVDENGGSNPLLIVVRSDNLEKLDESEAYDRMWKLQSAFADHGSVGSVISLPVIMAEGNEHWLGSLLPWNILLDILSKPEYGAIAKSFVTEDRTQALFMLRMRENDRTRDRLPIVNEITKLPLEYGFEVTATGGTYYLQGELAASVARSMTMGVITLIIMFGVIGFIVSGSLMVSVGVMVCAVCVSGIVLGTLGVFGIPVDIISSPAINICLGLIVDDMIHLTVTAKRHLKEMGGGSMRQLDVWQKALSTQARPAVVSTLAIMIGFSVFALSDFPPSQRFGLEIAYGAALAVVMALVVFPYIVRFGQQEKEEA
ncbi:efflux RND transporter permease subunit [Kordiimonas aestuarii]|uniref:efflux RND transporter permease subunit n=1 Tax=Kordiimonas aestuarii TaxID=1005925 RepID=UPI0021D0E6CF|nr:MMPL family transporter [Kordiimonas aestuarii]